MRFTRCIASKPGLFNGLDIDLSEKIVVISGKNGVGKSFLARSLVDALWGVGQDSRMLESDAWRDMYFELNFSLLEESYRFINNSMKSITLRELNGGEDRILFQENRNDVLEESLRNFINSRKNLCDFFNGFSSHSVYNTCFVPSSADCNGSTRIDYGSVKSVFLNDKTGFYDIHMVLNQNLENKSRLFCDIEVFNERKKKVEKQLQLIEIQESREEKLREEKESIEEEIKKIRDEIDVLENTIIVLTEIHTELERMDVLNNELETLRKEVKEEQLKMKRISRMKNELNQLFPQFNELDEGVDSNLDALQEIFIEIRNLNEEIDRFHSERGSRRNNLKKILAAVNLSAITAFLTILYRNSFTLDKNLLIYGIIASVDVFLSFVCIMLLVLSFRKASLEKLKHEKADLEKKLEPLLEKSRIKLEGYRLSELYEFLLQYFEDYVAFVDRKTELADYENSLRNKEDLKKIKEELNSLYSEEEAIKKRISDKIEAIDSVGDIVLEKNAISSSISSFEKQKDSLKDMLTVKDGILTKIMGDMKDDLSNRDENLVLLDEMKSIKKNLARLKKNDGVINWVGNMLSTAVERRESNLLYRLIDNTQQKFNYLTDNQHLGQIDEKLIRSFLTGEVLSENLNPAVFHTLLLAFKLSFSDFLIDANTCLPLIIDDPFLLMDDERVARFRELVDELSKKRQIIIFTHSRDKQDWGNYIEL